LPKTISPPQADIFTREPPGHSRFVFLQGHPEYDSGTLGREYLRDMGRFLNGEAPTPPVIPENYFDRATEEKLRAAGSDIAAHSAIVSGAIPLQAWRGNTVRLFANWLTLVAAAKARRSASRAVHTRRRAG
jgi:homoserine O-succinyltransferase